jgi:thiamine biosynthesis lipoprotein
MRFTLALCVIACLTAAAAWPAPRQRFTYTERQMGVDVTLTLYAAKETAANDAAARAFARIADLDRIFSDYNPDSEVVRLCRDAQPDRPIPVSADLFTVLQASKEFSARSNGAFDVSVSPLVKLWRRARRQKELPDAKLLEEARQLVDYRQILLNPEQRTVSLQRPGMQIDFGGIAKGYAAQEALKTLKAAGITRALVAVAGDISAGDAPPDAPGWKIGITPLDRPDGPPSRYVRLVNAAVSTSGDAFQFVEINGVRYSHIVDPKTGLGLTHSTSVTVIAKDGLTADGLATAANVVDRDAGLKLIAETPGAAGLIATRNGERIDVRTAGKLDEWTWKDGAP